MPLVMLSITSCSGNRYLDRPDNTNLTYWITQKVNENDFDDCTYLPGWFGANEYLDGRYAAIEEEGSVVRAPEIHVTYRTSGYPDSIDDVAVTNIDITDQNIYVYGLTMNSTSEEIEKTMLEEGFKKNVGESGATSFTKNNIGFLFSLEKISILSSTTNQTGIIY